MSMGAEREISAKDEVYYKQSEGSVEKNGAVNFPGWATRAFWAKKEGTSSTSVDLLYLEKMALAQPSQKICQRDYRMICHE